MRLSTILVVSAAFATLVSTEVSADGVGKFASKRSIDLDGKAPAELLQEWDGGQRVLFWSDSDRVWIQLFQGGRVSGVIDDDHSYFKRLVVDGRQWQWRNTGYVPLIEEAAVPASSTTDADFVAAVASLGADLGDQVQNSVANTTYLLKLKDADPVKGVFLASTVLCREGGAVCPVVLFLDGKPAFHTYLSQDAAWGLSSENGDLIFEYQLTTSVMQIDVQTGSEHELKQIEPRAAEEAPQRPRDAE